jgi:hypothetical protein
MIAYKSIAPEYNPFPQLRSVIGSQFSVSVVSLSSPFITQQLPHTAHQHTNYLSFQQHFRFKPVSTFVFYNIPA